MDRHYIYGLALAFLLPLLFYSILFSIFIKIVIYFSSNFVGTYNRDVQYSFDYPGLLPDDPMDELRLWISSNLTLL